MKRRTLLVAGATGAVLGVAGCVDELESVVGTDDDDVPGCTQIDEWGDVTDGPTDPDPNSIAGRLDCATAARPEPTGDRCETFEVEGEDGEVREFHSAGVEPYPDPPDAFDEGTLMSFVFEYERAYSYNSVVAEHGKNVVGRSVGMYEDETHVFDRDDLTVIRIGFGFGASIRYSDGSANAIDRFGEAAVYGIDETGIVRADAEFDEDDPEAFPDPVEDGELLECF